MKKLFLIDGNSFCYRAFYAIKSLRTSDGVPTNAVYGFFSMIKKIVSEETPDYIACAFDMKGPTFRHQAYESYKANRKPMPDELVEQLPKIRDLLDALRIPVFEVPGVEADDVLATLATKFASESLHVFIVTGDKDALQLVDDNISIYNTNKNGLIYNEKEVESHFGVLPSQIIDLIGLAGDKSDNIPGVTGIGPTTAVKLIGEFNSLDNLYSNLDSVKSASVRGKLEKFEPDARLSRQLATCEREVGINASLDEMTAKEPDKDKLVSLFKRFEFRSLLKDFAGEAFNNEEVSYKIVGSEKELAALIKKLSSSKEFVFDFETTSSDPIDAEIVGISFAVCEKEAFYIPVKGIASEGQTLFDIHVVLNGFRKIFESEDIFKIGQNIKYEFIVLKNYGIELKGIAFDTMIASYLLNPAKSNHNLDDIAAEYLGYKKISITELIGKGKNQITMDEVEVARTARYGCEDSDITLRLKNIFLPMLQEKGLIELFADIEMPLIKVLACMEIEGVKVDTDALVDLSKELGKTLDTLTEKIYKSAGEEFNINSPKQLGVILFEKLGLPVVKRTKTGFSTDTEVLAKLARTNEIAAYLLKYRELSKLKTTYVDGFLKLINQRTSRVHTSFNQTVAATGRLSSSKPNLQNIPVRTEAGRAVRKLFVVRDNKSVLLSADYSQIELRVLAHLSGDEALIDAFREGRDVHAHTAALIFDVEEDAVTKEMRSQAKTINFGIIYGMSAFRLAKDLNIEISVAKQFIDSYFARYAGVNSYIKECIEGARINGFVSTLFNRKRYIPELKSSNNNVRQFGERMAVNTPIQGTASDLIKKAMIDIFAEINSGALPVRMILQVHDELVFEVDKNVIKNTADMVKKKMQGVCNLKVPLSVNLKAGANWLDAAPVV